MSENLTLQLDRVIRAPRSSVFAAWTQPDELLHWFAPGPMRAQSIDVDLRVGGIFRWTMQGTLPGTAEPMLIAFSGVYQEIVPYELLRFSWQSEANPQDSTLVTIAFSDVDGGTQVALTQERIPTQEIYNRNSGGWSSMMDKLASLVQPVTVQAH
jgi:uncharacterized protein YndB with AHSA1/START domain